MNKENLLNVISLRSGLQLHLDGMMKDPSLARMAREMGYVGKTVKGLISDIDRKHPDLLGDWLRAEQLS